MTKTTVTSLGGGRQSIYMARKYPTDINIFADTGCEPDYVYEQIGMSGIEFIKVGKGDLYQDVIDYVNGKINRVAQLPLWFAPNMPLPRQCTLEYKISPIRKYLRDLKSKIYLNIGISLDEMQRMKDSNVKYIDNIYPLIENKITISQIIASYKNEGREIPNQSACLICPFHNNNYWKALKSKHPDEFEKACCFDDKIRVYPKMRNKLYLHKTCKTLRSIDFNSQQTIEFPDLIEECDGLCGL